MMLNREDILEHAKRFGAADAADLLLIAGPDGFDGDFDEMMEELTWLEFEPDDYRSATRGDYGPSNPWDAPGMSISDFI